MERIIPDQHGSMAVKIIKLKQRFRSKVDLYTYLETHRKYP